MPQAQNRGMAVENIHTTLDDLRVDINKVKTRKKNARRGDVGLIKESLEKNGQYRPIVVNKRSGEVLAGNHTLAAAKDLGWKEIAATYVDADEEQAARIVLIDNRANDVSGYDDKQLAGLLREFGEDLEGTGYTQKDITELLQSLGAAASNEGKTDPDDIPELEEGEPTTKEGDIWVLGQHRLICGDSTDPQVIEKLMDGKTADLLLTDPPYGVDYSAKAAVVNNGKKKHRDIANDGLGGLVLEDFVAAALKAALSVIPPGGPTYLFTPAGAEHSTFINAFQDQLKHAQTLIWVKQHFVLGRQDYQWQHEPILYGWKEGASHKWYGAFDKATVIEETKDITKMTKDELVETLTFLREQIETSVIHCPRPTKSDLHPTTKPVALLEQLINNSSQYQEIVLDIFAGSGSTLIAAERAGRKGYMVELDRTYCDVIVKRWEEHTGKTATHIPA